ncbi:hypothetical protein [Neisseria leonii]|uniref:hypothetical protein n=1 Tax=Neisseria leonii TaxID=2995413 RepID=UPI00237BA9B2|nr:hypothetical protein [Neisseria sp. 3986]MDD9326670.1 hypothetical protein [Neisseria sp. 3986]
MSESLFQRFAVDILRLHQQTANSWLVLEGRSGAEVVGSPYVHVDGCYYFSLPNDCGSVREQAAIVLIEDEQRSVRLSWVGEARRVACKDCKYAGACAALSRRCGEDAIGCLWELCPQQGRLSIQDQWDCALSPEHLQRALYPAAERVRRFADC